MTFYEVTPTHDSFTFHLGSELRKAPFFPPPNDDSHCTRGRLLLRAHRERGAQVWTRDPRETRTVKPKEHWGDALEQLEVARVVGPLRSGVLF